MKPGLSISEKIMLKTAFRQFTQRILGSKTIESSRAYDLWAAGYDHQPGNLMLDLDEDLFAKLLAGVDLRCRQVADIGCGTGRHWPRLIAEKPASLIGFDTSEEMLKRLREKFPGANAQLAAGDELFNFASKSYDVLCSTLTLAHLPDLSKAFREWDRLLRNGAHLLLTDFHPGMLSRGGQRSFSHEGKLVIIKNYIHSIEQIRQLATQLNWEEISYLERKVDGSVRDYYERRNALHVYENFKGSPVIYGFHFKKRE
jgi:SAM-dependent methyltransferase